MTAPTAEELRGDEARDVTAHPEIFVLDRNGRLVHKFVGVVSTYELETTLRPLLR